jgi:hypothetical protein
MTDETAAPTIIAVITTSVSSTGGALLVDQSGSNTASQFIMIQCVLDHYKKILA